MSPAGTCDDFDYSEYLGTTLYKGGFDPEFRTAPTTGLPPHQNFTVFVPTTIAQGPAVLTLSHFSLVGVGYIPYNADCNLNY